jgi:hypothetical protein
MAVIGAVSSYDMIQAHRARLRSFADLAEQRSASRQEAAQRTLSFGDSTRNALATTASDYNAGTSQLLASIIRTRSAADAKAKAEPSKWYA